MSDPTFVALNTGDTKDDDAQVIDSLVQQEADPPAPDDMPLVRTHTVRVTPAAPTRFIPAGFMSVDPAWTQPILLVPSALKRLHVLLRVGVTAAGTDYLEVTDEIGRAAGRIYGSTTIQQQQTFDDWTGALWVRAVGGAVIPVSYWAW